MKLGPILQIYGDDEAGWGAYVIGLPEVNVEGATTRQQAVAQAESQAKLLLEKYCSEDRSASESTVAEIAQIVADAKSIRIEGRNSHKEYRLPGGPVERVLDMTKLRGVLNFSPADQVVEVLAGTPIESLQLALALEFQCIPIVDWYDGYSPLNFGRSTVGGLISMNLPEYLEAEHGSWRDWVLGATLILADGRIVKSGSQVVKSVAGYDLHKLAVGSRGTLAIVASVILRTHSLASLSEPNFLLPIQGGSYHPQLWIQRVPPDCFEGAWEASRHRSHEACPDTSTMWLMVPPDQELNRYPGDWVIRSGCGEKNLQFTDPIQIALMKRAKEIFDPTHKLNPGEMGIF